MNHLTENIGFRSQHRMAKPNKKLIAGKKIHFMDKQEAFRERRHLHVCDL